MPIASRTKADARRELFLAVELLMRGRCRMDRERACVADVDLLAPVLLASADVRTKDACGRETTLVASLSRTGGAKKPPDVADHALRQALGDTVSDQIQRSEGAGHLA